MSSSLRSALPEVYRSILPPFFDEPAPVEEKATCSNCAMAPPQGVDPAALPEDVLYFRPDVKCCSFQPTIPNYLLGAILRDERPDMAEGRRRIRAKIAGRVGVTPPWLFPPKKASILFNASRVSSFGRSLVLRCPYYEADGGLCTIWRQREAVCSSFFCKYMTGADGEAFWLGHRDYLRFVERRLGAHALSVVAPELDTLPARRDVLTLEELEDRPPSEASYAAMWRGWAGREEELYLACHDCIAALDRDDYDRILQGDAHDDHFATLLAAYARLISPELPARLMLRPDLVAREVEGGVLVTTYSVYEPLLLTPDLHAVLKEFGPGETVAEVRARLARDAGIEIPDAMLLSLHQMQVVVAAT